MLTCLYTNYLLLKPEDMTRNIFWIKSNVHQDVELYFEITDGYWESLPIKMDLKSKIQVTAPHDESEALVVYLN